MTNTVEYPAAIDLRTLSFSPEFTPGAHNAVATCLRIQPSEKVTIITDRKCAEIAASMVLELEHVGCEWNAFVLEDFAQRPLTGCLKRCSKTWRARR